MAEEVKIHPGVVVGAGLLLGLGGILLYALRARAAPPVVYTCPYCGAPFPTQDELDAHIRDEHPEVPPVFTCPYCGAEFSTQEERNAHILAEHPALIAVSVIAGTDLFKRFLQGALVSIDDRSGYTGKLGGIAFPELAAGTYSVTCSYNDWLIDKVYYTRGLGGSLYEGAQVTINPGEEIFMRFVMKPRPWEE